MPELAAASWPLRASRQAGSSTRAPFEPEGQRVRNRLIDGPSIGGNDIDEDAELTQSLHRVLATLIKVRRDRSPLPVDRLLERLQLVQWLRGELAAVERLLSDEYDRVRRAAAPGAGTAPSPAPGSDARSPVDGSGASVPVARSGASVPVAGSDAPIAG